MGSGGWKSSTWGADENWGDGEETEREEEEEEIGSVALGASFVGVRDELPINV